MRHSYLTQHVAQFINVILKTDGLIELSTLIFCIVLVVGFSLVERKNWKCFV